MALASDYYQVAPATTATPSMLGMGTGAGMSAPLSANVATNASYGASASFGGSALWVLVIFAGLALWYHVVE